MSISKIHLVKMSGKTKDYISASQIKTYIFCPILFKFNYIDNLNLNTPNFYGLFGSVIHKTLAITNDFYIKNKQYPNITQVLQIYKDTYIKEIVDFKSNYYSYMPSDTQERSCILSGELILTNYLKNIAPMVTPKYVEYPFKLKLKNYPITIHGFIDLITEDDYIIDYKTCGQSYKQTWNQRSIDKDLQFTIYSAAFKKTFTKSEKGVIVEVLPRIAPYYYRLTTTRTDEDIKKILGFASDMEEITSKKQIFMPNLSNCNLCPAKNTCKKRLIT